MSPVNGGAAEKAGVRKSHQMCFDLQKPSLSVGIRPHKDIYIFIFGFDSPYAGWGGQGQPCWTWWYNKGEMLLEVNGESMYSLSHKEVVSKIKQSGQQVTLTTMPPQGKEFYTKVNLQS